MKTWIGGLAVLASANVAAAQDTRLGTKGESCAATRDCSGELRCISNRCTTLEDAAHAKDASGGDWMKLKLDDGELHPFLGLVVLGGPVLAGIGANGKFDSGQTQGAFLFALKGGLVSGPHEASLEISPMTYFYAPNTGGPAFQFNVTYRYLVKLYESGDGLQVFYPIGLGAGLFTGNTSSDVFFQARLDLFGVMVKVGHVLIDLHLPSFRYGVTSVGFLGTTANVDTFTWLFGAGIGYAF